MAVRVFEEYDQDQITDQVLQEPRSYLAIITASGVSKLHSSWVPL